MEEKKSRGRTGRGEKKPKPSLAKQAQSYMSEVTGQARFYICTIV